MRSLYEVPIGILEWKRKLGRLCDKWKDNIKIDIN
jgi:hypothetical protein